MASATQMSTYKKRMRVHISKSLSIVKSWDVIGPIVAENIGGPEYSHIPYLVDTNAYQIGHIFVQEPTEVQCFCAAPMLKVLGPIRDFIKHEKGDAKWSSTDLNAIKTTDDNVNFLVEIENGKNLLKFRGFDYYFLEKGADMKVQGHVNIDRSTHEDLSRVEWFGLITGVVAARIWELIVIRGQRERTFYVSDKTHTILFKYDICRMNDKGVVHETSSEKMECRWLPVEERNLDTLPLTEFVSQCARLNRK